MNLPRYLLNGLACLAIGAALACVGGAKDASTEGGSGSAINTPATSEVPSASITPGTTAKPGSTTTAQVVDLTSFRFDVAVKMDLGKLPAPGPYDDPGLTEFLTQFLGVFTDFKAEGAFVAPDKMQVTAKVGGQDSQMVQIADKAWMKEGSAAWTVVPPGEVTPFDASTFQTTVSSFAPPPELTQYAKSSKESVNGVSTTKYSMDKAAFVKAAVAAGEDPTDFNDVSSLDFNYWLSDKNIPVKMSMTVKANDAGQSQTVSFEMNLKNINDSSIQIKAPI